MKISALYFWFYLKKFSEKNKIILYGEKKDIIHLREITETAGFKVEYLIGHEQSDGVLSYIDLLYENPDEIYVWIISYDHMEYCKRLDDIGLKENVNYASITRPPYMSLRERFILDVHLGYTYETLKELKGVTVFGKKIHGKENLTIVTLGGSTSDSIAYPWKSWSEILQEKLSELYKEKNVIVYSAGVCAYNSSLELIKLERDMIRLKPDLVISYSGLNDSVIRNDLWTTSYQKNIFNRLGIKEKFNIAGGSTQSGLSVGLETDDTPVKFYLNNMRLMHAICNEFGVKFYGFLQAMMGEETYKMKDDEAEMIENSMDTVFYSTKNFLDEAKREIKHYEYMFDLSTIFNIDEKVYIDTEHVNELGNNIIADEIIKKIKIQ